MKLPNAENAFIANEKIYGYCLSEEHIEGRHKANVFRSVLGMTADDGAELISAILAAILTNEAVFEKTINFGEMWRVDFPFIRNRREVVIRTAWIIRNEEDFPRLVSCFIL